MNLPYRPVSRRRFISQTIAGAVALCTLPLPSWAKTWSRGVDAIESSDEFQLTIGETPVTLDGRPAIATGVNGTVPGPLIRMRQGSDVHLRVANALGEDSSIHWHGILLPYQMDGVPGVSFAGIPPERDFDYRFTVRQSGTYWYHSHSDLQEQTGVYGPLIIDPDGPDPVAYDREFVILLSDWTFEDPQRLFAKLKKMDAYYNYQRRTVADFFADAREQGVGPTVADRRMWGNMRMAATDISDVTGATYTYLLNGHGPDDNWTGLFDRGERLRLRLINGSAMSIFNFQVPGLSMDVVQADGINVQPVTVQELQIGVAETYDVVLQPNDDRAYTLFAQSIDSSGYARGTLTPDAALTAEVPEMRPRPVLSARDMGMAHHGTEHAGHTMAARQTHDHRTGPGVANINEMPSSRLNEPGTGLDDIPHRALCYADLRRLDPVPDARKPSRTIELHLTGNMERYMWSFDGVKFSEVTGPIRFTHDERVRLVLVNDTMMNHPIHLHGMFFELENGNADHNPSKHTITVKPGEKLSVTLSANEPGDWAFHCHLLYHMKAGMMRVVSVA